MRRECPAAQRQQARIAPAATTVVAREPPPARLRLWAMPPARTVAMAREAAKAPPMVRATVLTPPTAMEAAMAAVNRTAKVPVERRPTL